MAIKFPGNTIRLSDTIDQYARRVHINVRNGKVTLVYRWKDHKSTKAHTQRVTLDDTQAGRLLASVAVAATVAVGEDNVRQVLLGKTVESEENMLADKCEE
ncbi:inhibitor of host toxin/antitoxin system [Salmonella phage JSS1]|uniref:Inhibitor of host toxin/antitoxin system n=1 Tax=Salmonella phage JSS1 TaxID=2972748 RepID=A0AAE9NJS6_9CAUD|nr:inhibitor of host toxin/antitoxin system [Salmonella phage JSS1]